MAGLVYAGEDSARHVCAVCAVNYPLLLFIAIPLAFRAISRDQNHAHTINNSAVVGERPIPIILFTRILCCNVNPHSDAQF